MHLNSTSGPIDMCMLQRSRPCLRRSPTCRSGGTAGGGGGIFHSLVAIVEGLVEGGVVRSDRAVFAWVKAADSSVGELGVGGIDEEGAVACKYEPDRRVCGLNEVAGMIEDVCALQQQQQRASSHTSCYRAELLQ
jgi:hypothetical protein